MCRYRGIGIAAGVTLIFAALAVSAMAAGGFSMKTKSKGGSLPNDGASHSLTVSCPQKFLAVGGGSSFDDPTGDFAEGSFPKGTRKWKTIVLGGPAAPPTARQTAKVRCIKGRSVRIEKHSEVVPPTTAATASATCPDGWRVSGGGIRVLHNDADYVAATYPSGRKWKATSYNPNASVPSLVTAYAYCVRGIMTDVKQRTVTLPSTGVSVPVKLKCKKHSVIAGGGIRVASPSRDFAGSTYPLQSNEWKSIAATSSTTNSSTMTSYAVCLKK